MFYSIADNDEWSQDHWDERGHYTTDGECLSPSNGIYFMAALGKRIFKSIDVRYTDAAIRCFINEQEIQSAVKVTENEIVKFLALVQSVYHERTIEEFNEAMWEYVDDCAYSYWNDVFSAHDLCLACRLQEPDGWPVP
jgi:carbonic anhydrase